MNIRVLKYLVALSETGHFGQAAARCFVTQPTLSTQIKRFEERLGVMLVERDQPVRLTDIGVVIVQRARRILAEAEAIVELARAQQDPLTGRLRVGLIPTLGPYLLPRVMTALRAELPELELLLYEYQTARILDTLERGTLDMGVLALPVPAEGLAVRELFDEAFYVALPARHALASRNTLEVEDLEGERLLLLEDGHCLRDQALEVCGNARVDEVPGFRATSLETVRHMVNAGIGLTLLPELAVGVQGRDSGPEVRPFSQPVPTRTIGAIWRKRTARGPAIEAVCDVIARRWRDQPAGQSGRREQLR